MEHPQGVPRPNNLHDFEVNIFAPARLALFRAPRAASSLGFPSDSPGFYPSLLFSSSLQCRGDGGVQSHGGASGGAGFHLPPPSLPRSKSRWVEDKETLQLPCKVCERRGIYDSFSPVTVSSGKGEEGEGGTKKLGEVCEDGESMSNISVVHILVIVVVILFILSVIGIVTWCVCRRR